MTITPLGAAVGALALIAVISASVAAQLVAANENTMCVCRHARMFHAHDRHSVDCSLCMCGRFRRLRRLLPSRP